MPLKFDREKAKQKIARVLDKVTTEADPQLLSAYRGLFKKEVSFFRRSWAAAYLLMLYDQGTPDARNDRAAGGSQKNRTPDRNPRQEPRSEAPRTAPHDEERRSQGNPPTILAEDESRRLFVSIGRNRHLFPREILGLIITRAQVSREDIGAIRILDSYSFVQVRDTVADTIIEALNGTMFRGRTLAVNYARSKREEAGDGAAVAAVVADDPADIDDQDDVNSDDSAATTVDDAVDTEDAAGDDDYPEDEGADEESEEESEENLEQDDDHSGEEGV
jgi:hypothetical protein